MVDHDRPHGPSPAAIVNSSLVIGIGVTIALVVAAERIPALPFALELDGERVVRSDTQQTITEIRKPGGEPFRLEPIDLIEEPDVVDSWDELNAFYARQAELHARLSEPTLEVSSDGTWTTLAVVTRGLLEPRPAPPHLTPREREVLELLASGHSVVSAAAELEISEHTAKTHVKSLYRKLDVSSRASLVRTAIEEGLT